MKEGIELIDFFRKEFYLKNRMNVGWFSRRAMRGLKGFKKLSDKDWNNMKSYVESILVKIEEKIEIITLEDFISKDLEIQKAGFKDLVQIFSLNTKIDMKDILILLSALRMVPQPHVFLTQDDAFRSEGKRISMLEEFLKQLPFQITIKFYSPKPPEGKSMDEYLEIICRRCNLEASLN